MKKIKLQDSETIHNMARAFAGECQSNVRLKMIAKKAKDEGQFELSAYLYEIAKRDCIHATLLYDAIIYEEQNLQQNIEINAGFPFKHGTLIENILHAAEIKQAEGNVIYSAFATIAQDEGFTEIEKLFKQLAEVEKYHAECLYELHDLVKNESLYKTKEKNKWVCKKCGFYVTGKQAHAECPLCKSGKGCFMFYME